MWPKLPPDFRIETATAVRQATTVVMTGMYQREGSDPETVEVLIDPANPGPGVRELSAWYRERTTTLAVLERAKQVMIDRLCTELPDMDWEQLGALWEETR